MKFAELGKTGARVSRIWLGGMSFGNEQPWMLDGEAANRVIQRAVDLGVNYFDTADVYSDGRSEEILGAALEGRPDTFVATKVGLPFGADPQNSGLAPAWIRQQVAGSLLRLRRRRLELYQIHRWDYRTPIAETLQALTGLVRDGTVSHLGASAMYSWQFMQALATSEQLGLERFSTMQNRYSLVYREEEREMIPLCRQFGIAVIPYSPLAMGFLSGKYRKGETGRSIRFETSRVLRDSYFFENDFDVLDVVREVAREKGVSVPQVALAWLLSKPEVPAVILGATHPDQVSDAVGALDLRLGADDVRRLEEKYVAHKVFGPIPAPK